MDKEHLPADEEALSEDLLTVWLRLTSVVNNQRLVKDLSFNEAVVCNLLMAAQRSGRALTATDLCAATCILKSQMNSILLSLERKGLIHRQQSSEDRRRIELRLLPLGVERYAAAHQPILALIRRLIDALGEEQVQQLIPALSRVADTFVTIQKEN